ncbi:unnamed protein product [Trichogramma brassicae]|uniref:Uncharacterized protein n=1 Tax=Trichogramma brassicae TaxID=86971 RepID=A0A6H5IRQ4_9HYME|nr:unnamed protein product [Trichogramma brassicae]
MRVILNPKPEQNVVFTAESLDNFQTATGVTRNHMNKMILNYYYIQSTAQALLHEIADSTIRFSGIRVHFQRPDPVDFMFFGWLNPNQSSGFCHQIDLRSFEGHLKVGKGIPHCCRGASSTAVRDNVSNFVEKLPEMQQNQILTSLLKRRLTDSKDNDIILNTSGAKMRVILNPKPEQNVVFTAESLDNFQTATGVTRNHMNKMILNYYYIQSTAQALLHEIADSTIRFSGIRVHAHKIKKIFSSRDRTQWTLCSLGNFSTKLETLSRTAVEDAPLQQCGIPPYLRFPYSRISLIRDSSNVARSLHSRTQFRSFAVFFGNFFDFEYTIYGSFSYFFKKVCAAVKMNHRSDKSKILKSTVIKNFEEDDEDDDLYVIEKCVLPELHLLQGFVNHLFWKGLVPEVGREKALLWPKKLSLVPKNYQGIPPYLRFPYSRISLIRDSSNVARSLHSRTQFRSFAVFFGNFFDFEYTIYGSFSYFFKKVCAAVKMNHRSDKSKILKSTVIKNFGNFSTKLETLSRTAVEDAPLQQCGIPPYLRFPYSRISLIRDSSNVARSLHSRTQFRSFAVFFGNFFDFEYTIYGSFSYFFKKVCAASAKRLPTSSRKFNLHPVSGVQYLFSIGYLTINGKKIYMEILLRELQLRLCIYLKRLSGVTPGVLTAMFVQPRAFVNEEGQWWSVGKNMRRIVGNAAEAAYHTKTGVPMD